MSFEPLKSMTGIDVLYVPYKSAALAMTDLLAGRVAAQITNMPLHLDNVRTGKARVPGVTSAKRSPRMAEQGVAAEPLDAKQFAAFLKSETVKWARVVKDAGLPQQ